MPQASSHFMRACLMVLPRSEANTDQCSSSGLRQPSGLPGGANVGRCGVAGPVQP